MQTLMNDLEPAQKARLHEVADLMLEIYRTFVRMRYIDQDWITLGPHDIESLIPMYRSHGIDDSVIYLYSILPYLTFGSRDRDFFGGGEFVCFLDEQDVVAGRDPFFSNDILKPWMTPLSAIGNHDAALVYCAKTHRIWIYNQPGSRSADPALQYPPRDRLHTAEAGLGNREIFRDPSQGLAHRHGHSDTAHERGKHGHEEHDAQGGGSSTHGHDGAREDELSSNEEPRESVYTYKKLNSRPADDVLRDIARWYRELQEVPGGGEHSGLKWDKDIVEPLYRKHGWPDAGFDGDAFLVDLARAYAAGRARYDAEEPLRNVEGLEDWIEDENSPVWQALEDEIAAATTVDSEWSARWTLLQTMRRNDDTVRELRQAQEEAERLCPGGIAQNPDDLPLWEAERLRRDYSDAQLLMERAQQNVTRGMDTDKATQLNLRRAEEEVSIYKKAYEASKLDTERLCPGRTFSEATGRENMRGLPSLRDDTEAAALHRRAIDAMRLFRAELPDGAANTKAEVDREIENLELYIENIGKPPKPPRKRK